MGILQQLQIALNLGSYTRKKHLAVMAKLQNCVGFAVHTMN